MYSNSFALRSKNWPVSKTSTEGSFTGLLLCFREETTESKYEFKERISKVEEMLSLFYAQMNALKQRMDEKSKHSDNEISRRDQIIDILRQEIR